VEGRDRRAGGGRASAGRLECEAVSDTPMTATYVRVLIVEASIILALWLFGRVFS
jgi:hypothetical protein